MMMRCFSVDFGYRKLFGYDKGKREPRVDRPRTTNTLLSSVFSFRDAHACLLLLEAKAAAEEDDALACYAGVLSLRLCMVLLTRE